MTNSSKQTDMTDTTEKTDDDKTKKAPLSLGGGKGTLSLKGGAAVGAKATISQPSRSGKTVAVEVRRKRTGSTTAPMARPQTETHVEEEIIVAPPPAATSPLTNELRKLTSEEREARIRALQQAEEDSKRKPTDEPAPQEYGFGAPVHKPEADPAELTKDARQRELEELQRIEDEEQRAKKQNESRYASPGARPAPGPDYLRPEDIKRAPSGIREVGTKMLDADAEEEESYRARMKKSNTRATPAKRDDADRRGAGKMTIQTALNEDKLYDKEKGRSMAAMRRARERARLAGLETQQKVMREVILPEYITVQELANRMTERSADVVKSLMKMGVMTTVTETIDADTAELIIHEFGHTFKRVTEGDVEIGMEGVEDTSEQLMRRAPVVTIMGHVDHGKTSLLDALRSTDVVAGEAGGITQHIGAYQVTLPSGAKITFLDTPGHAAFTEMRARGANVTDIVVLVVAANDSIMPQTVEAINHAKAAGVPIIVAINKVDLPDANVKKVKQDLLQHEIIVEELSGETQCVEVSAKKRINLDKLEEAILLQAEVLDLKANPNRDAIGTVIEAKLEQGRGNVATVLIEKGTLKIGDIFVAGAESGRVRAIIDDRGQQIKTAGPGQPVEVLGLQGSPSAGDNLTVVADEHKAREISAYRQRKKRETAAAGISRRTSSLEELMAVEKEGQKTTLSVILKGDVNGSVEAIIGSLKKISDENPEVLVRVLHSGVGGITESDVILANASKALLIGFNVRANAQARQLADRDGVEVRYYNIIYNIIDDAKALLSGMLSPNLREDYLGQAEIRQVFNITKVGKVGGCMVTAGIVKRGSHVRLLRDSVVVHEGKLKTLKRFKEEVKEVREGMECGMAFENYDNIMVGDIIECFDVVSEARTIE
ncbi:MAG: translation initiation factor IF-2 [Micavibrio sp.]